MLSKEEKEYYERIIKAIQGMRKDIKECLDRIEKREKEERNDK